jgi:glycosyltransferase involved in cell wall biosynthesis
MRVLVVTQYFWPENFRINDLARELVKRGYDVTVLTGLPNYPAGKVFEAFERDRKTFDHYAGIDVRRIPMLARGSGNLQLLLNYLSFVVGACVFGPWRLRGLDFDVVFVFEPSPVTVGLPAVLLGRLKRAPVVFWVQDLWPETLVAVGVVRSPKVLAAVGKLVRFIYNRCALVLGQSHGFLGSITQYCADVKKIRYFPNWAEDVFSLTDIAPAPEVPAREDAFNILFAGNVGEAQDFPAVLDAAESLKHNPAIRWLIVGDGRMTGWLRTEVVRRGLEHCFLLLGRFPLERMPSFYAHTDVLLVSLKRDPIFALTIPGKVQSYLLAGIPLLGMLDGEGADIIRNANAGLACPAGEAKQLAQAVLQLGAMSDSERQQLGKNGRAYAQKEFNRDMLMERLESWFEEIVNAGRQR